MADSYLDMQMRIADEVQDGNITANIKSAIQDAIKLYRGTRFYFNQKTASFNTVANQEYYDGSALSDIPNLIEIESAVISNTGIKSEIVLETFDNIDAW